MKEHKKRNKSALLFILLIIIFGLTVSYFDNIKTYFESKKLCSNAGSYAPAAENNFSGFVDEHYTYGNGKFKTKDEAREYCITQMNALLKR